MQQPTLFKNGRLHRVILTADSLKTFRLHQPTLNALQQLTLLRNGNLHQVTLTAVQQLTLFKVQELTILKHLNTNQLLH